MKNSASFILELLLTFIGAIPLSAPSGRNQSICNDKPRRTLQVAQILYTCLLHDTNFMRRPISESESNNFTKSIIMQYKLEKALIRCIAMQHYRSTQ